MAEGESAVDGEKGAVGEGCECLRLAVTREGEGWERHQGLRQWNGRRVGPDLSYPLARPLDPTKSLA